MTYMRTALAHRHQLVVVLDDTPSSSVLHLSKRNEPRKLADYFTQDGRHRRGAPSLYHGHTVRSRLWRPSRCRDAGNRPRAKCKEQTTGNAGGAVQIENCITKAPGMRYILKSYVIVMSSLAFQLDSKNPSVFTQLTRTSTANRS